MNIPEYLSSFSGDGDIEIQVKFKGHDGFVKNEKMCAHEISALVSDFTGEFHNRMTFDEHPFEVYKYEINPAKKKLIIFAKELQSQN